MTRPDLDIGAARTWLDAHVNLESTGLPPGADVGVDPARIETFDTVEDAVARAQAVTDDDAQIVVTGSLYTVGAARTACRRLGLLA